MSRTGAVPAFSTRARVIVAALVLLLVAPQAASAQQAARPGRLVIIGGALARTNEAVYRSILDGRQGSGPICIIPTAGATPETAMDGPAAIFDGFGGAGTAKGVLVSEQQPETAHDPAVVAQIRQCSGFFFIGGQQSRITRAFRPEGQSTPALDALLERFREGAVVSGSSAGAAMMSHPMIAGGTSIAALANGVTRARGAVSDDDEPRGATGVSVSDGLGLFPAALVDQHFLARGRIGRLLVAVLEMDEFDLGFGIDENTALVVDGDTAYTMGASGVVIVDGRGARRDGRSGSDVALHLMGVGDRFSLSSRTLTVAADKMPVPAATVAVPEDLFASWSFLHLLHQLGGAADAAVTVPITGGQVVLRKAPQFAARQRAGAGVQGTPAALSVTGLTVDVRR